MSSKSNSFGPKGAKEAPSIHPIWRGIGFVMILMTPVTSWAAGEVAVEMLKPLPDQNIKALFYGLRGGFSLPSWLSYVPILNNALHWVATYPDIKIKILFFIVALLIFSGLLSLLYAMIYRLMGPPRYGPLDVPAPRVNIKRYKR